MGSRYCAGVRLCEECSTKVGLAKRAKADRVRQKIPSVSGAHHQRAKAEAARVAEEVKAEVWTAVLQRARGECECCSRIARPLEPHHLILGERVDAVESVMALCGECHRWGKRSAHNAPRWFAQNVVIPWAKPYGFPLPNRKEYRP